jgi:hypothetical protein
MHAPTATRQDRREDRRRSVDLLVNRFLDGYPYLCRATDISRRGIRIMPLLEPGAAPRYMGLQFQLPGSADVITASGEAVNGPATGERGAVGVRFTRLPASAAVLIERFLTGDS